MLKFHNECLFQSQIRNSKKRKLPQNRKMYVSCVHNLWHTHTLSFRNLQWITCFINGIIFVILACKMKINWDGPDNCSSHYSFQIFLQYMPYTKGFLGLQVRELSLPGKSCFLVISTDHVSFSTDQQLELKFYFLEFQLRFWISSVSYKFNIYRVEPWLSMSIIDPLHVNVNAVLDAILVCQFVCYLRQDTLEILPGP